MRVSFDGGRLNERGVAVALFDYAFHARALIGVEAVILHDARIPPDPRHVARFANEFPTYAYESEDEMQRLIERERIDVAYFLKTARKDFARFALEFKPRSTRCSSSSIPMAIPTPMSRSGCPRR